MSAHPCARTWVGLPGCWVTARACVDPDRQAWEPASQGGCRWPSLLPECPLKSPDPPMPGRLQLSRPMTRPHPQASSLGQGSWATATGQQSGTPIRRPSPEPDRGHQGLPLPPQHTPQDLWPHPSDCHLSGPLQWEVPAAWGLCFPRALAQPEAVGWEGLLPWGHQSGWGRGEEKQVGPFSVSTHTPGRCLGWEPHQRSGSRKPGPGGRPGCVLSGSWAPRE